jgi:hypothetical protein
MKRFKLVRYIGPNEVIPAFYGVVWHEWATFRYAVLPMPLALPFGMARWIWAGLLTATKTMALDPRTAYLDGFRHGLMRALANSGAEKYRRIFGQDCK